MESKIKIKTAQIEVEFEGEELFIRTELVKLIASVTDISRERELEDIPDTPIEPKPPIKPSPSKPNGIQLSTTDIAAKLDANNERELILAACARLELVKKMKQYEKQEILSEMKSASSYYTKWYASNFSKCLKALIKDGKLNNPETDIYTLSPKAKSELRAAIDK